MDSNTFYRMITAATNGFTVATKWIIKHDKTLTSSIKASFSLTTASKAWICTWGYRKENYITTWRKHSTMAAQWTAAKKYLHCEGYLCKTLKAKRVWRFRNRQMYKCRTKYKKKRFWTDRKATWRSELMSHSSAILLWSSSISMVTLKFWGAIRGELGQPDTSFHEQTWNSILSVSSLWIGEYYSNLVKKEQILLLWEKSSVDSQVPLPEEKQSWQWDSGSLSPEKKKKKKINNNYGNTCSVLHFLLHYILAADNS